MSIEIKEGIYPIPEADEISSNIIDNIAAFASEHINLYAYTIREIIQEEIGTQWTNRWGNWPKRFAKVMKKTGHTFDNNVLSKIGKMARESCILSNARNLIVTGNYNWAPGTYGEGVKSPEKQSCFWTARSAAKVILKESDSLALLIHGENDKPISRCWCTPWEESYVLYNCYCVYGEPITLISFARVLSDVFNFPYYRNIHLTCRGLTSGPLWINAEGKGYIVGGHEVSSIDDVNLPHYVECDECGDECKSEAILRGNEVICIDCQNGNRLRCAECGQRLNGDDDEAFYPWDGAAAYCESCFDKLFSICDRCESYCETGELAKVGYNQWWCEGCRDDYAVTCDYCGDTVPENTSTFLEEEDVSVCETCCENHAVQCAQCEDWLYAKNAIQTSEDEWVCSTCYEEHYFVCSECNEVLHITTGESGTGMCYVCQGKLDEDAEAEVAVG